MSIKSRNLKKKYLRTEYYLLAFIFILALAIRLFIAFQTDHLALGDAYFSYRQTESIAETGVPSFADELSFSGRLSIFHPLFYYILAGFSFLFGTVSALKIMPNLFASLLVVIVYFISLELTRNKKASLVASIAAAFIPVFFANTVISASTVSFTLPLIFYCLYCFMRISEKKFLFQFLIFSFILALSGAISFLFVFALLLYLLFFNLEFKKRNRIELESILFVTFFTLWINVLIYKKAFLFHSYSLIWRNLPTQVLSEYFRQVDIITSVTGVGLLTLLLGVFAVHRYMFKERDKRTYLLMAFAVAVAALLWFKLLTLTAGLMFLGAILVPLFGQAIHLFLKYIEKTRVANLSGLILVVLLALILLTSMLPSIARASESIENAVSDEDIESLDWLRYNTPEGAVVLSTVKEGQLINAIAERKNVADSNFILIKNSDKVFDDVATMYTSFFKTGAVELMTEYNVDYIYFSPRAKMEFGIDELKYVEKDCFSLVYDGEIKIYEVLCSLKIND